MPSELLQYMRTQLGSKNVSDKVLRSMWLNRLPSSVTQVIAPMMRSAALDELAESADLVASRLENNVNAIHTPQPISSPNALTEFEKRITLLQQQVQQLTIALQSRERSRTPSARKHNRHQSRSRDRSKLCYYHSKFGDRAQKCKSPCRRANQETPGEQHLVSSDARITTQPSAKGPRLPLLATPSFEHLCSFC